MDPHDAYRTSLRAAVRGLWVGALSHAEFTDAIQRAIEHYLTQAWREGAAPYDLTLDQLSDAEVRALKDMIATQWSYVPAFTDAIVRGSKANGGMLSPLLDRVARWVNRYDETVNLARMMAAADEKLIWHTHPKKQHCRTCGPLDGWVKRASYWRQFYEETGIRPRSKKLECGGWVCGCSLDPTRRPLSKGRPPAVGVA